MTEKPSTNQMLEAFFEASRADAPVPGEDLISRILADAAEAQPVAVPVSAPRSRRLGWRAALAALGGWPALGGLATATVAGIWIGVAQPAGLDGFAQTYLGFASASDTVGLVTGYDELLVEG